ncbi:hypothetical protein FHX75_12108 [Micromonospora palomenae]|uniref:Uncharacterized protein n=1 Tax=Micromonospora palomenae TaxID=1461247 RepID=A0A561WCL7_9ACTN|nr:hypothetical protein [Micromonospora palomenae]TWG21595.1 hypothetical protein FHX75_12108 [Micromonospora palomenae]
MLCLPAYSSPTDLPPQAVNALSPSQVPILGLALVAIGGFLLWRAAQRSNPSRQEERRGGIAFLVLGCLIGAAGVVNIWLD